MTNPSFVNGSYYHIYNRGVEKRKIFLDRWDYLRFLETLDFYRKSPTPMKLSDFRRGVVKLKKAEKQKEIIKILSYCLMPNHFHLLVHQLQDGGISKFISQLSNSFTKYFNTKHKRVGPLFQGTFKAKIIENDEYLLQVSKYIHRNPFLLSKSGFPPSRWEGKVYPYSSYGYYLSRQQHPFCDCSFILAYFSRVNPKLNYQSFVEESEDYDPPVFDLFIDLE